jgi:hypothetical protein
LTIVKLVGQTCWMSHHLVGSSEAAAILGVSRQRLNQIVAQAPDFPRPDAVLTCGRIWTRDAVETWATGHQTGHRRQAISQPGPLGDRPAEIDEIVKLAISEARALNHTWLGIDHLVLALLRPECPGRARLVLESLGIKYQELRQAWTDDQGDPFEPSGGGTIAVSTHTQLVLERANSKAAHLQDDNVTSEHLLLAIADSWDASWTTQHIRKRGVDADAVRECILAQDSTTDSGGNAERSELNLALSPAGFDPMRRRPWGSAVFQVHGRPVRDGRILLQYFIDRDGYPVLTVHGEPIHVQFDSKGTIARDSLGNAILTVVTIPPGAELKHYRRGKGDPGQ